MLKKSLSEQIYDLLRMDIINRKIQLGEKLINKNLQERFGVSSTPIRDAINRLQLEGLLTDVSKAGAKVIELDNDTFRECNEVLSILSCGILKNTLKQNLQEVIKTLEECVEMQEKHIDTEEYFEYDYKFHKTFFEYSSNKMSVDLFKRYNALHELLVRYYHISNKTKKKALESHKIIINALKSGDFGLVFDEMERHYTLHKVS